MRTGKGTILETYYDGLATARIACPENLIPSPGQYILADAESSDVATLPIPLFRAGGSKQGFMAASPIPPNWSPGTLLNLRGPLGNGFNLPPKARSVGLGAFGDTSQRLAALIEPAIEQGAGVTLLTNGRPSQGLPHELEIMPLEALSEIIKWADYLALDMPREMLPVLLEKIPAMEIRAEVEILLTSPIPCGGRGDCGVCAVKLKGGYKLICKDGPVFNLRQVIGA